MGGVVNGWSADGRTILRDGVLVGLMDSAELAAEVVEACNGTPFHWARPGVPDEAVELAARALHAFVHADPAGPCKAWGAHSDGYRRAYRKLARNALVAVAPMLVAEAVSP